MRGAFSVHVTPHYERLVRKLLKQHPDLRLLQDQVREILETDPYNVSRRHPIKKLEGVSAFGTHEN